MSYTRGGGAPPPAGSLGSLLFFCLLGVAILGAPGVSAQPYELHGSGTTIPSKFFWKVMGTLEGRARTPVSMT